MSEKPPLGAKLCIITSTKFLDSGGTEMRVEFVCSQAFTYESVEEAIREAQLEEAELGEEKKTQESNTVIREAQLEEAELVEEKRTQESNTLIIRWSTSVDGLRRRYVSFQSII